MDDGGELDCRRLMIDGVDGLLSCDDDDDDDNVVMGLRRKYLCRFRLADSSESLSFSPFSFWSELSREFSDLSEEPCRGRTELPC